MEQPWDPSDDVPTVVRRGNYVPPTWTPRQDPPGEDASDSQVRRREFSLKRTAGLLALVLLIIYVPLEFVITYFEHSEIEGRTTLTLGFVWAVVIEAVAVWVLIRLLTRR